MKKKIAFFDTKPYDKRSFDSTVGIEEYEIEYFETRLTERSMALTKGFDIVCAFVNDEITAPVIDQLYANGIRLIAMRCAGYNNVDVCHALDKIRIVRVPAYSPHAVAEHALALLMTLNRKIHRAHLRTRDSNFSIVGLVGMDMYGKTVGVIGAGKIGRIMVDILCGLGMDVLVYDKYQDKAWAESKGVRYTELSEIYEKAQVISLHCPLTDESHHLINKESIAQMRDGVMIINTSRGPLIDTKALIKGLKSGKIGAAGLDVYEEEADYFFEDYSEEIVTDDVLARLLTFNNVVVTSHQAFLTEEALANISGTTLKNINTFYAGEHGANEICGNCDAGSCVRHTKRTA